MKLTQISQAFGALARLLYTRPKYLVLALVVSVLFYQLVFWFLNLGLASYLFTNPYLSIGDKLALVVGSYTDLFSPPYSRLGLTLLLVSFVQGAVIAGLTYCMVSARQQQQRFGKEISGVGAVGVFSVFGLGCAACGTSLVTPILALFTATSSVALAEAIGFYAAVLALILTIITAYLAGRKVHLYLMMDDQKNNRQ